MSSIIARTGSLTLLVVGTLALGAASFTVNPATIASAPSSAAGGTPVAVTGTSPSGEAGTSFFVDDNTTSIPFSVSWEGQKYTLKFLMPLHDPKTMNEVDISVTPHAPHGGASHAILVTP